MLARLRPITSAVTAPSTLISTKPAFTITASGSASAVAVAASSSAAVAFSSCWRI